MVKVVVRAAGWVAERAAAQAVAGWGEAKVGAGAVERVEVALKTRGSKRQQHWY